MSLLKGPENPTPVKLIWRALVWALVLGAGTTAFLYALAFFFGETEKSFLIAFYWGPITAAMVFTALLIFQMPRAMKMKKGRFFVYLLITSLPLFGLGALFLWWLFQT